MPVHPASRKSRCSSTQTVETSRKSTAVNKLQEFIYPAESPKVSVQTETCWSPGLCLIPAASSVSLLFIIVCFCYCKGVGVQKCRIQRILRNQASTVVFVYLHQRHTDLKDPASDPLMWDYGYELGGTLARSGVDFEGLWM
ncbi:hypothetical protein WMY93_003220 [Mugilogobius chulae]|uniref:Uncharacterized protein n=1 Tax=Mugilogobius chulae TaxID=88201 RepID=A0AAW0PYR3_9GOBI